MALEYVSLLSHPTAGSNRELVEQLLLQVEESNSDTSLDVQVRRAEAWLQAGDENAFVNCMAQVIESQSLLATESQEALVYPLCAVGVGRSLND
jgi:hypothetical protein